MAILRNQPWLDLSLAEFAARLRRGEFTAEAATVSYLERIAVFDARLGAFSQVAADQALAAARATDLLLRGGTDLGPLMGVPVALKTLFSVDGMPGDAGSDLDVSSLIEPEGGFVKRLKRAGCVILGKTRTTEFALGGVNLRHRMPWNPCDAACARTPGGSSHGSAVAMAAQLCGFAVGSDAGGSVRQPAALCGVFGYKASPGLWPTDGVFPLSTTMDSIGTFTRSARDAALVFAALAGRPEPRPRRLRGLRLGRPTNHFFDELDAEVQTCVDGALALLAEEGVEIVPIEVPQAAEIDTVFARMVPAELIATLGKERFLASKDVIDAVAWARAIGALDLSAHEYIRLYRRHGELCRIAREAMRADGLDGWVSPTTPGVPVPLAECATLETAAAWNKRATHATRPGNLFGQCGVSLPIHMLGARLPVGLQIVCSAGEDAALLGIARGIEDALGLPPRADLSGFA